METATKGNSRSEYWREVVARQQRSGMEVRPYCEQQGIREPSFYAWRKRLKQQEPLSFALVETHAMKHSPELLELILTTGERLRISAGVDGSTLRKVLEALRP